MTENSPMSEPKSQDVMINAQELEELRQAAQRYRWLRERSVRIQGVKFGTPAVLWTIASMWDGITWRSRVNRL